MQLAWGAVVGSTAFLVGYFVTWILAGSKAASITVGGPLGGAVPDWKVVLWLFYDSHFVGTRTPRIFGPDGGLWGGGDIIDTVGAFGVEYLFAVPILILALGGAIMAIRSGVATPQDGFRTGLKIAVGYIAVVMLALFVATEGGIAPSPLRAVVIAGLVYPVVFGALGGLIVGFFRDETGEKQPDPAVRS
jgi:hypothetical protein